MPWTLAGESLWVVTEGSFALGGAIFLVQSLAVRVMTGGVDDLALVFCFTIPYPLEAAGEATPSPGT